MTKSAKLTLTDKTKLLQEEKERLRKLRLIQVREISKQHAAQMRTSYKSKKDEEIRKSLEKHKFTKNEQHKEGVKQMQHLVESHIDNIGQGHQNAAKYDDRLEDRLKQQIEHKEIAALRGKFALEIHREEKQETENKENAHIIARQFALEQEKLRASYIAKLPPKPNEFEENDKNSSKTIKKTSKMVSYHDANAYTTTRYHMPTGCVDKQIHSLDTVDARKEAVTAESRLNEIEMDQARQTQERKEKARLRGKHALEKEILNDNYNEILTELNVLEKADREKRQKELMNIPKEIFLPAWQRQQDKNEKQLELEREFEKIYTDSNLRAQHEIPQPVDLKQLEISQSNFEDADLDLTLVDDTLNKTQIPNVNNANKQSIQAIPEQEKSVIVVDVPNLTTVSQQTTSSKSENAALSKLLDKIRKQREQVSKTSASFRASNKGEEEEEKQIETPVNVNDTVESELWSTPNSSMKLNDDVDEPIKLDENQISISSESFKSSSESSLVTNEATEKQKNLKQIRGIMMSSHNVSSLNEIENTNFKRKAVITKNIRLNSDTTNQSLICVPNTATHSIDLSHVSRDHMVAGSKEIFNASNEAKLAAEHKRKQLESKQLELEKRLKELEKKEAELKQQELLEEQSRQSLITSNQQQVINAKTSSINGSTTGCDSGNDHNYCSDSVDSFTPRHIEDLKRIEYQQALLKSASEKQFHKHLIKSDETSSECSNSTTTTTQNRLEERKSEILKRFGLSQDLLAKKPPPAPVSIINSEDKHTSSSVADSGFSSSLTRSLNNNLNNRQSINLEVEKLNNEIIKKTQKLQQQNDDDLLSYLSTSNLDELMRRLSSGSNSSLFSGDKLNEQQLNRLFGLEFFESPDVRDLSVEKIIELNRLNDLSNRFSSSSSTCSNDTSNDGDNIDYSQDNNTLIINLLNNKNRQQQLNESDLMRQHIQEQLELVRQKKDQLQQQQRLSMPLKSNHKSFDNNLHELSTIKEVDTPISERNLKLTQTSKQQSTNKSLLNDISSSFALSESSLENVTQLSENNNNNNQFHTSLKSIKEQTSLSDSFSSNNSANKVSNSNNSFGSVCTSTSTPLQPQSNLMSVNSMRQKQMQLFDASLFDYSSSGSSPTKLSKNMSNLKLTEYGAQIYDDLSTNNLDLSNTMLNSTKKTNSAFKTESTNGSLDLSVMKQKIISRKSDINNLSNKKWFEILATSDDDSENKTLNSSNSLIQHPISSSNNTTNNNNMTLLSEQSTSLKQYSLDSTNNRTSSFKLERTLNEYKSPPKKLTKENTTNSGLFDRFIQSYNGQSSSVQDEPELSFVSYKTVSNPVSPTKKTYTSLISETINQTTSYASTTCSSSKSNDSNLSLIQIQQKQLMKQFANLSPIDQSKLVNSNIKAMSSCVDFTLFDSTKSNAENITNDATSSLILFSPNNDTKIENNSNPFIKFDEQDYTVLDTISSNNIESALTGVTSFNNFNNTKRKTSKGMLSSLEPIQDTSRSSSSSNNSLVSFEQHELTQCTPMSLKFKTISTPMNTKTDSTSSSSSSSSSDKNTFDLKSFLNEDMSLIFKDK